MKRIPLMAAAGALVLAAGTASAAQTSGPIERIDEVGQTITIGNTVFTVSPTNTVGPGVTELREGDEVRVFHSHQSGPEDRYHAMTITRIGEAGADGTDEMTGVVEQVDTTANTFVIDGTTFVVPDHGPAAELGELSEGEEVMVVYDTTATEEPIEVINLSRTQ